MTTERKAQRYSIVASNHVPGADAIIKALAIGADLFLVREPTNEYDTNAVAVWTVERRIGYVPKANNTVLARFIDTQGEPFASVGGNALFAMDAAVMAQKAIKATFQRSPNSAFPQAEI